MTFLFGLQCAGPSPAQAIVHVWRWMRVRALPASLIISLDQFALLLLSARVEGLLGPSEAFAQMIAGKPCDSG